MSHTGEQAVAAHFAPDNVSLPTIRAASFSRAGHRATRRCQFGLVLYLTGEQLEQLERMRGGGAFFFRLDLHALVKGKHGLQRSVEQLWFEASLSCWSAVFEQVGYLDCP